MNRLPPLCLFVLGLSACSATPDHGLLARVDSTPIGATSGASPPVRGVDAKSGASAILALPSQAHVRGGLEERRYANGWRQSVPLDRAVAAKGWNELTVDIRTDEAAVRDGAIPMGKPTEDGLRRELALRFPTTQMRIVAKPLQNALGPFGLAVGAGTNGMRCAFAWQWVDDLRAVSTRGDATGSSVIRGAEIPASIRLRVCRKGVTEEQFADWFTRLQATEAINVARVVEAARGGAAAVDEAPAAGNGGERIAPPATLASVVPTSVAPTSAETPAHRPKRRTARKPKAAPPRLEEPATTEVRRYQPPARTAAAASRLDPGLPPQAYAGPPATKAAAR